MDYDKRATSATPEELKITFDSSTELANTGLRRMSRARSGEDSYILKGLREEYADDFDYLDLLTAEFSRLVEIDSPYVAIPVGLASSSPIGPCLVLADRKGVRLTRWMSQLRSMKDKTQLALDIVGALAELHSVGFVHGDIRPSNLFVLEINNTPWLANVAVEECEVYDRFVAKRGVDQYAPPEYADGLKLQPTADVYGLGRVLEYLGVDKKYASVVKRATDPDPSRRYADASQMLAAMKRRGSRLPLVISVVIAALVLVTLLIIAVVAWRRPLPSRNIAGDGAAAQAVEQTAP